MRQDNQKTMQGPENIFLQDIQLVPGLYIIATPIGNLRDITLRALDTLHACDLVLCEDSRVSGKLLHAYGLKKPLKTYNDHSSEKERAKILQMLVDDKKSIALVSDAGSPMVSDPGYKLVKDCADHGVSVTAVPGASAVISALQLSALPSNEFSFAGFVPSKEKARGAFYKEWKPLTNTWLCFETPPRLLASLKTMLDVLGDRKIAVARELTKLHEDVFRGSVTDAIAYYESGQSALKGEIVLVIDGLENTTGLSEEEIAERLAALLKDMKTKDAVNLLADDVSMTKSELYDMALKLKGEH